MMIVKPDPDGMNATRQDMAQKALDTFIQIAGLHGESMRTAFGDLLCDMIHLCDLHGWNFDEAIAGARANYAVETYGEKEDAGEYDLAARHEREQQRLLDEATDNKED